MESLFYQEQNGGWKRSWLRAEQGGWNRSLTKNAKNETEQNDCSSTQNEANGTEQNKN